MEGFYETPPLLNESLSHFLYEKQVSNFLGRVSSQLNKKLVLLLVLVVFQWTHCSPELNWAFLSLAVNQSRLRVATLIPLQTNAMASNRSSITLSTQNSEPSGTRRDLSLETNLDETVVQVVRWFLFEYISLSYYAFLVYSDSLVLLYIQENDCKVDIQSFKDDPSKIEAMTVQELRMALR